MTKTIRFGDSAAALSIANWIVWKGISRDPVPLLLGALLETKYARAALPSTPSQSVSSKPRSGASAAPGWAAGSSGAQSPAAKPSPSTSRAAQAGFAPASRSTTSRGIARRSWVTRPTVRPGPGPVDHPRE